MVCVWIGFVWLGIVWCICLVFCYFVVDWWLCFGLMMVGVSCWVACFCLSRFVVDFNFWLLYVLVWFVTLGC